MDTTQHMSAAEYRAMTENKPSGTDDNRRLISRRSSDGGHIFEELLMRGCRYYEDAGRAVIGKVYEPYRAIKKLSGGRFIGQWTGRAEPDFKGVLRGGRAIAFEAKSTRKGRIQRNALTDEQVSWLEKQAAAGAAAFVCVQIKDRFFTVPWYLWSDMKELYGKKFLMPGDIAEYEVEYDGAVKFLDLINGKKLDEQRGGLGVV